MKAPKNIEIQNWEPQKMTLAYVCVKISASVPPWGRTTHQSRCSSQRVKSGKFGHQVNSDTHLQTVEIQMRRLLMSRLIRIFAVCLVNLFFISNN